MRKALSMPVNFVWSCPPDPETDLKNFQREQAKIRSCLSSHQGAASAVRSALAARAYLQLPTNWTG